MKSETQLHAERIWNYLSSFESKGPCDAIVLCCSYDLRVCDYACELLKKKLLPKAKAITFVTKPNTMLRVKLTAPIQWPEARAFVSCPTIRFPDELSNVVGLFGIISEMVGDIQRIIEYPKLGYQVDHKFPSDIMESWEYLKAQGFTHHLMGENKSFEN